MNLTVLKGNLGDDPVVKDLQSGKVCRFSLATSESWKNKDGEKVTDTQWHRIVFFGSVCDVIKSYFKKGDQIIVTGKIKYGSYENKDGETVYTTDIVCKDFDFCGKSEKKETGDKQGEWQGKKPVASMSNADDLPIRAEDDPSYDPFA